MENICRRGHFQSLSFWLCVLTHRHPVLEKLGSATSSYGCVLFCVLYGAHADPNLSLSPSTTPGVCYFECYTLFMPIQTLACLPVLHPGCYFECSTVLMPIQTLACLPLQLCTRLCPARTHRQLVARSGRGVVDYLIRRRIYITPP